MKKSFLFLFVILTLLFVKVAYSQIYPEYLPYGYSIKSKVSRVIDGDTFVLTDSLHVRMLGINTPEVAHLGKPAQPFGDSAAHFARSLLNGQKVKLTFDGKTYGIFGRLLAYVWLLNSKGKDSLFVQAELLKAGLAHISHYPKGKRFYDLFYNLRRTAMHKNLGIWGLK